MGRPQKYKTDEERRLARNAYQKKYKRDHRSIPDYRVSRTEAAYDPIRDGEPQHASLTARLCGDPPIGRSALETRKS